METIILEEFVETAQQPIHKITVVFKIQVSKKMKFMREE